MGAQDSHGPFFVAWLWMHDGDCSPHRFLDEAEGPVNPDSRQESGVGFHNDKGGAQEPVAPVFEAGEDLMGSCMKLVTAINQGQKSGGVDKDPPLADGPGDSLH